MAVNLIRSCFLHHFQNAQAPRVAAALPAKGRLQEEQDSDGDGGQREAALKIARSEDQIGDGRTTREHSHRTSATFLDYLTIPRPSSNFQIHATSPVKADQILLIPWSPVSVLGHLSLKYRDGLKGGPQVL